MSNVVLTLVFMSLIHILERENLNAFGHCLLLIPLAIAESLGYLEQTCSSGLVLYHGLF